MTPDRETPHGLGPSGDQEPSGPPPAGDPDCPDDYAPPVDDDALLAACRVEMFRAGGPGGQHQNKAESGVRLTHGPTGITVVARESRSQYRNRKTALARLRAALEERTRPETPRIPTKVPRREKERRLEEKRRRSERKRGRQKPERGE
ncbi:MAG: peptide chain release factor family protein [Gemmatimonadota bacterium]